MRIAGNIRQIKNSRDSRNKDIAVYLDKVEYITQKKDGKYYQAFDFVDELDTPLVITGDCLALAHEKQIEEGEYEFYVYDKAGEDEDYERNENKYLSLTVTYDYDANVTILTSASYTVTVSNEEFQQLKTARSKARKQKQGKGRKNR